MFRKAALFGSVVIGMTAVWSVSASADERKFTYSNEAKVLPEGTFEFEPWITLRARKEEGTFRAWDLRAELEYGVTDRLTAAFYLNFEAEQVSDVPGLPDEHEFEFEGVSIEGKYKLSDPSADLLGTLAYVEVSAEDDELELELKAVASKHLGSFTLAYNFVFEVEREEEEEPSGDKEWETEYIVQNTLGVSYDVLPAFAVGLEGVTRSAYEGKISLSANDGTAYFAGPNVHLSLPSAWATLTVLRQVDLADDGLDLDHYEKYEVRLIVGVSF